MQCPKCGYVMSEMDRECLRCKRAGGKPVIPAKRAPSLSPSSPLETEKKCPLCGAPARLDAPLCPQCGYQYEPGISGEERYQAALAAEARTGPLPLALRRTLSPWVSGSVVGLCLIVVLGAGWIMFGGEINGPDEAGNVGAPIASLRHHRRGRPGALHTVTYRVTGTGGVAAVSYAGPDGTMVSPAAAVTLPWTQSFQAKTGAALSLSAKPSESGAAVAAEIDVDHVPRKQERSPDEDGSLNVTATL